MLWWSRILYGKKEKVNKVIVISSEWEMEREFEKSFVCLSSLDCLVDRRGMMCCIMLGNWSKAENERIDPIYGRCFYILLEWHMLKWRIAKSKSNTLFFIVCCWPVSPTRQKYQIRNKVIKYWRLWNRGERNVNTMQCEKCYPFLLCVENFMFSINYKIVFPTK